MEQNNNIEMLDDISTNVEQNTNTNIQQNTSTNIEQNNTNNIQNNNNKKSNKIIIAIIFIILIVIIIGVILLLKNKNDNQVYKITYMNNEEVVQVIEVKKGEKLKRPITPNMEGYIFDGWTLDNNKIDFDTYTIDKDITLYASFIKNGAIENEPDENDNPEEEHDYMDSPPDEEELIDEELIEEE